MKKNIWRRLLVCVLSVGMVLSLGGMTALAVETDDAGVKTLDSSGGSEAFDIYSAADTSLSFYADNTVPSGETINGLYKGSDGVWRYYVDGVATDYTGFARNSEGVWYVENGIVTFEKNGVLEDTTGAIGEAGAWYYVVGSKVQSGFTGLADYPNENGWWYIKNGKVDFTANTVAKNQYGWFYVKDGKVDFTYNGFAKNANGWWYIEDGKVTFEKNGVLEDTTGVIGEAGVWYYVLESKVQFDYTGLANGGNGNELWYIQNGVADISYTGFVENSEGAWYVEDGKVTLKKKEILEDKTGAIGKKGAFYYVIDSKVQDDYTGVADFKKDGIWWYIKNGEVDSYYSGFGKNSNGKWYVENGVVTFAKNDVIKDTTGAIGSKGTWYYVVGSKVQTGYTGAANYKNSNGWWYIKNGKVDFFANTVAKNKNGWWYVTGGKVQFGYTGVANYKNENGWWYINGGKVNFNFTGVAKNKNGYWYVKGGKVQFGYSGRVSYGGRTYNIRSGKVV